MIRTLLSLSLWLCLSFPLLAAEPEAVRTFGPDQPAREITLRTTTDVNILAPAIKAFLDTQPGLAIRFEQWGSNDLYDISEADCAKGKPGAELVISSGVQHVVKLVNDNCAATWISPETTALPKDLRWRDQVWGISREPAVMIYNRALVPPEDVPRTRFDLVDLLRPAQSPYTGKIATYDIADSGLGFLFAFLDSQEASTFGGLMEAFARSGAVATCCSAEIIDGVAGGRYLIAYNILGSYAAQAARDNPDLGIIAPADYTLVLSRAAYLPGPEPDPTAAKLLDFLLSPAGQRALAQTKLIDPIANDGGGSDSDETLTLQRLIALGPPLLVATDTMKAARFLERWRDTFAQ
ncbi:ABC transporter substrate-binding protein [Thioclava nitratireducens]|uniref:ABC transporter substrate-binding protein n=1 Tax=Thioclava nitratireducens TaxID=1915078 RepID=UPI00247FEE69|nr:ABC transporter substrate-binding protein [Thioclava nitratireducens]WGT50542.1 ABC transporter substrate-binding protein [Thioclava nitratireducens]